MEQQVGGAPKEAAKDQESVHRGHQWPTQHWWIGFLGCSSTSLEAEYSHELLVLNATGLDGIISSSESLLPVDRRKRAAAKGSRSPREVASSSLSRTRGRPCEPWNNPWEIRCWCWIVPVSCTLQVLGICRACGISARSYADAQRALSRPVLHQQRSWSRHGHGVPAIAAGCVH